MEGNSRSRTAISMQAPEKDFDLDLELMTRYLQNGQHKYNNAEWENAELCLRKVSTKFPKSNSGGEIGLEKDDIQLMIAATCMEQRKLNDAKSLLRPLAVWKSSSNKSRTYVASHVLADLYLYEQDLQRAESFALLAVTGRRKLLGSTSLLYLASVKLLTLVYEHKADMVELDAWKPILQAVESQDISASTIPMSSVCSWRGNGNLTDSVSFTIKIPALCEDQRPQEQRESGKHIGQVRKEVDSMGGALEIVFQGANIAMKLPAIPKKRYRADTLSAVQFKKCSEPWAMSSILNWIMELAQEERELKEKNIAEGIAALFMHKVPTLWIGEAESLGDRVVKEMLAANAIVRKGKFVTFGPGTISGVLYQLTGTGCYSSKLHLYENKGRCYMYRCTRIFESTKKSEDWATFYKIKKEDIGTRRKEVIVRQNALHEVVTSEERYINQLYLLGKLYRDRLSAAQPPIIPANRLSTFLQVVFGGVDKIKTVNEDYLLRQLKYRQTEQGPWIVGFNDIFHQGIQKARPVYIEYATTLPRADYLIRQEVEQNTYFKRFLDQFLANKRLNQLSLEFYLTAPLNRLKQYSLLLSAVRRYIPAEGKETQNHILSVIRAASFECDTKYTETTKWMELPEIKAKLRLQSSMEREVDLCLDHPSREIVFRGDLRRTEGLEWVDTHAILFDHYLVLANPLSLGPRGGYYCISQVPIRMDVLVLESSTDAEGLKLFFNGIGEKLMYPFCVKHCGKTQTYTLCAPSAHSRQQWCEAIIQAKTKYAAATFYPNRDL
jgi:hypothetical protein